ncbi:MAG: molybdopterin-dependent oxidoreductase [Myxococcota bacterium]
MPILPTTCRICESACGLLADVEDGRVVGLRPDPDHPVSRGFACKKGTTFHERLARPDRITRPRLNGRPVDWDTALRHVGDELDRLVDRYGPGSVGLYSGNALGHSFSGVLGLEAFQRAFAGCKHYSCLTLDNSEMFAVAEWVFGHPLTTFVADYVRADALVLFGTDPLSSQPSQAQSHPHGPRDLRANRGALVVVDPRRSATAAAARVHLQPRVSTDVFVLAWLVRRALERGSTRHPSEHDGLLRAVAGFTLARVSRVSGLTEAALQDLDEHLASAQHPLVWSGLGVLLGPHGTLGWWLTVCLQALTGGIGPGTCWRPGGSGRLRRVLANVPLKGRDPEQRSRIGDWPAMLGTSPAATLAEDILTPGDGQLRALVVLGGEPLRALPDAGRAREAFDALELLVTVGIFGGDTADRSHVFLPAASWLERRESGVHNLAQRPLAFLRRDDAVVPAAGEARRDWDILLDLCRSAGRVPFASRTVDRLLRWTGADPETLTRWVDLAKDGLEPRQPDARLAVPVLCDALASLPDPAPGLRLLTTVRPPTAMNHWIRPATEPSALVHPEDLAEAGLSEGPVAVEGPAGRLVLEVVADAGLARGTVVVPFGGPNNPNEVIGTADLEPFSGQPWSNGTVVRLTPV